MSEGRIWFLGLGLTFVFFAYDWVLSFSRRLRKARSTKIRRQCEIAQARNEVYLWRATAREQGDIIKDLVQQTSNQRTDFEAVIALQKKTGLKTIRGGDEL